MRTRSAITALAVLVAPLCFAASAPAASVQIGQLAPSSITAGGCNACTDLQQETVAPARSYEVPAGNWVLSSWGAEGGEKGGTLKLRIFRPTATAGQFRLIAETGYQTVAPKSVGTFPVDIPVEPGDRLGLETGLGTSEGSQTYPATYPAGAGDVEYGVAGAPAIGQTVGPGGEFGAGINHGVLLNVAATLTTPVHTLTVGVSGSGVVFDKPLGIDCIAASCPYRFATGTSLVLEALPGPGDVFAGWSGACAGTGLCRVSLTSDLSVAASFVPEPARPDLVLGPLKRNLSRGTAWLSIAVPGAGSLSLTSYGARKVVRQLSAAATIGLPVKPAAKARRQLAANGRAKVALAITFTPSGGPPHTVMRAVTLRERQR